MATVLLPFHQDERVGPDSIELPSPAGYQTVEPRLPDGDQWTRLVQLYDVLGSDVAASVTAGEATTVVTGDCLALLGTLAGVQRAGLEPSIVWFDAHGDVNTMSSSTSGYPGGMALRMALGEDREVLAGPLGLLPVPESRTVLVDARDLDPAEVVYLAGADITRKQVCDITADDLPAGPVLLHVDLDIIDAAELPGLRFPASPGPTSGSVLAALERLLASDRVVAFDVACPWHDPRDGTEARRRRDLLAAVVALNTGR